MYLHWLFCFVLLTNPVTAGDPSILALTDESKHASTIDDSFVSPLMATRKGFLASISMGEQKELKLLVIDTGSTLLWIKCNLHSPKEVKAFDPLKSSTYQSVYCDDFACVTEKEHVGRWCNRTSLSRNCYYLAKYGDGSTSIGHLASDIVGFGSKRVRILFGCSRSSSMTTGDGVLGLGADFDGLFSILLQTRVKSFGYCVGNMSDENYAHNKLIIGGRVQRLINQTPLILMGRKYMINLDCIHIPDRSLCLGIDPKLFKFDPEHLTGGVLIDSGSTYTYLLTDAAEKLRKAVRYEVESLTSLERTNSVEFGANKYRLLCYNGEFRRDLVGFPNFQFVFEGGAFLNVNKESMFQQWSKEVFCLAIVPTHTRLGGNSLNILGSMMQQFHYMMFDLEKNKLNFQEMECSTVV